MLTRQRSGKWNDQRESPRRVRKGRSLTARRHQGKLTPCQEERWKTIIHIHHHYPWSLLHRSSLCRLWHPKQIPYLERQYTPVIVYEESVTRKRGGDSGAPNGIVYVWKSVRWWKPAALTAKVTSLRYNCETVLLNSVRYVRPFFETRKTILCCRIEYSKKCSQQS